MRCIKRDSYVRPKVLISIEIILKRRIELHVLHQLQDMRVGGTERAVQGSRVPRRVRVRRIPKPLGVALKTRERLTQVSADM